jgi:2-dehydro-3-deoxygluconokinase
LAGKQGDGGAPEIVCFGEVMTRLSATSGTRLAAAGRLDLHVGGAEANVAVALVALGHRAGLVTAVPEGALGDGAWHFLRGAGVDLRDAFRCPGRQGLYFLDPGASLRPSEILYDRADSAFARTDWSTIDWRAILAGARWLHVSGITPALGPQLAVATRDAMAAARALGVRISFDGNYRPRLWERWDSRPRDILYELVAHADLFFANHRDMTLLLDREFSSDHETRRREAALVGFEAFPNLSLIASTARHVETVGCHRIAARIDGREVSHQTCEVRVTGIIDRIGSGDAFAAGVLHGLMLEKAACEAAELGLALGCLKHSVAGDVALFGREDLAAFAVEGGDVRR